jgi:hypothetical protein
MHLLIAVLALLAVPQHGPQTASPQAQDVTVPPATAHVKTTVVGLGVQVYKCAAQDGKFQWVLETPEATLFDPTTKQSVGTHSAGPTWTWSDGSSITGNVLKKQPSTDPAAIPWLLVQTHDAGTATGMLTGITYVRRSDTQAGAAPATGCDAQSQENHVRVPYQATYTFYTSN